MEDGGGEAPEARRRKVLGELKEPLYKSVSLSHAGGGTGGWTSTRHRARGEASVAHPRAADSPASRLAAAGSRRETSPPVPSTGPVMEPRAKRPEASGSPAVRGRRPWYTWPSRPGAP